MLTIEQVRSVFIDMKNDREFVIDKTGVKTLEMIGAAFLADEPTIFGELNHDYIERELEWYKSCSLNVNDIPPPVPKIWKDVATPDGFINSNYGWAIWSEENGSQYNHVFRELGANPNSRRAIMIYTRPSMHTDYKLDGMSDFMCTNTVQYMIRGDTLVAIVNMRSNDVVFGYRNDWAWQKYVVDNLAHDLSVENTAILWQVGSLHVYERHFDLVK